MITIDEIREEKIKELLKEYSRVEDEWIRKETYYQNRLESIEKQIQFWNKQ